MAIYARLGVLYYVIYNPDYWQRDRHQPFEVYRLIDQEYQQQIGEPFWMPEVKLGMGRSVVQTGGLQREVLCWYDQQRNRYQTLEEIALLRQQQLEAQQQLLDRYRQQFGDLPEA